VLDVRVKKRVELSTDHHLFVFILSLDKPSRPISTCSTRKSYRLKWEALVDNDARKAFADIVYRTCCEHHRMHSEREGGLWLFREASW